MLKRVLIFNLTAAVHQRERYFLLDLNTSGNTERLEHQQIQVENVQYHWDNRRKLSNDYIKLKHYNARTLNLLVTALNRYHGVDYELRQWQLIVGVWTYKLVGIGIDRIERLIYAVEKYHIDEIRIESIIGQAIVPADSLDLNMVYGRDFNVIIYRLIAETLYPEKLESAKGITQDKYRGCDGLEVKAWKPTNVRPTVRFKEWSLKKLLALFSGQKIFFYKSGLNRKQLIDLNLRVGQLPLPWEWCSPKLSCELQSVNRGGSRLFSDDSDLVQQIINKLIEIYIPTGFLEGYGIMVEFTDQLVWPQYPSVVFSSHGWTDDIFNIWLARKINQGTKLINAQHGGNLGVERPTVSEDHQVGVCDLFLTWGWRKQTATNILPSGYFGLRNPLKRAKARPDGGLLLLMTVIPEIPSRVGFNPIGPNQSRIYYAEQVSFVCELKEEIQERLVVRIDHALERAVKTSYSDRLEEDMPGISIDLSKGSVLERVNCNRLMVCAYRATGYIEAICADYPTIAFWNVHLWENRDDVAQIFSLLKEVGIFHDDPVSAARFVNDNWDNIGCWWKSESVQEARKIFSHQLGRTTKAPLKELCRYIDRVRHG